MTLKDTLVISGQSGIFKYISQSRNSIIVESLIDQKRANIPSTAKISMLEDISIYGENDEIPLREILKSIQTRENGGQALSHKSPDQKLKEYFGEVAPNYDKERVYLSDIKKVIMWYNMLQEVGINDFEAPKEEAANEEENQSKSE